MAQDLRKLFSAERHKKHPMKPGHEERFLKRLDRELPVRKRVRFVPWQVAATVLVLVGIAFVVYKQIPVPVTKTVVVEAKNETNSPAAISLGDLSPDLKKVENYYVANINLELSQLEISEDNKAMVDGFMERLGELNNEYKMLNRELNEIGPNDQTITALIKNLQLRLQLLQKLKGKLIELKSSENEQVKSNTI